MTFVNTISPEEMALIAQAAEVWLPGHGYDYLFIPPDYRVGDVDAAVALLHRDRRSVLYG